MNWRGRPLTSLRTIIELNSAKNITTGLTIQADYDSNWYPNDDMVTDAELAALPLAKHDFHRERHYTINAPSNSA